MRDQRRRGAALGFAGALCTAIAVVGGFLHQDARSGGSGESVLVQTDAGPATSGGPALTAGDVDPHVTVQVLTYDPGQSSGWHRHAGVHSIAVVAGVLTVIDAACVASTHTPDEPYLGGQDAHLAVNDTDVAVRLVVTHATTRHVGAGDSTVVVPAPPGCRPQ